MDRDLQTKKDLIVRYFLDKGLEPHIIFKIIEYLAHSVFIYPQRSAFEIRETLYNSKLPVVDLEESLLQQIKSCLIIEGRKGLEYRLGKGFSYLSHSKEL
jgi:hypothetical protein